MWTICALFLQWELINLYFQLRSCEYISQPVEVSCVLVTFHNFYLLTLAKKLTLKGRHSSSPSSKQDWCRLYPSLCGNYRFKGKNQIYIYDRHQRYALYLYFFLWMRRRRLISFYRYSHDGIDGTKLCNGLDWVPLDCPKWYFGCHVTSTTSMINCETRENMIWLDTGKETRKAKGE